MTGGVVVALFFGLIAMLGGISALAVILGMRGV